MNVETAQALVDSATRQLAEAGDILTRALEKAAKAQRDVEHARDHYQGAVSLLSERERLLRETRIREAGGQHP